MCGLARRDRWIRTPGYNVVAIVDWNYAKATVGRDVVFELRDDDGRQQFLQFNLAVSSLRNGDLLRFVVAARNRDGAQYAGQELAIASRDQFDSLIGRRIDVLIRKEKSGLYKVVNWKSVSQQ